VVTAAAEVAAVTTGAATTETCAVLPSLWGRRRRPHRVVGHFFAVAKMPVPLVCVAMAV
jgi:hypothetical protein